MSKRDDLLVSIANTIQDYKGGGLATPEHVNNWIVQFDKAVQLPMLREMGHVLKNTYLSCADVTSFLKGLLKAKELVGDEPCAFWHGVNFLHQRGGNSQKEMLRFFDPILKDRCGFGVEECGGESAEYVYLDDGIFTGNRIIQDIKPWIDNDTPAEAKVHIITIVLHRGGNWYARRELKDAVRNAKKNIVFIWWPAAIELEDRRTYTNSSDVLRPTAIPDDDMVKAYVDKMKHKPTLRTAGQVGSKGIFSSDEGRRLIEQEFLKAGVRIRNARPNLDEKYRPLGYSLLETLGFGSLVVTFRNCPNTAPLALWGTYSWDPLFPRTTNTETEFNRWPASLKKGKEK